MSRTYRKVPDPDAIHHKRYVVEFAGHTSGHSAYYDYRSKRPEILTRSEAEPKRQARGFWHVVNVEVQS
jgi:hypothetical protein